MISIVPDPSTRLSEFGDQPRSHRAQRCEMHGPQLNVRPAGKRRQLSETLSVAYRISLLQNPLMALDIFELRNKSTRFYLPEREFGGLSAREELSDLSYK